MPASDPRNREDYDRLYYRLDLEPGASAADIKHNYRQLAQIFHPDKWRHPSPASLHWASEQFKRIKEAREVLEAYWSVHEEAPASRVAQSDAQVARVREQVRELQLNRERLRGELDSLQSAKLRGLAEFARMQTERERLIGELMRLREEATHERASAAERRKQAQAAGSAKSANGDGGNRGNRGNGNHQGTDLALPERHPVRDFFYSRFDDPARGWLMTLSGLVVMCIVVFVVAHKIVFSVFDAAGSWRWLGETLQGLLIAVGVVLVSGFAWAQRTFYRADRAGREHGMPLPAHETWLRVNAALRGTGRHGAEWHIETVKQLPGDTGFELRAVLRYSTAREGQSGGEARQAVTFLCHARAASAGETRIAWGFGVQAPAWWLLPAARVVRDLRRRIEMDLAARL
ncbi:Chaperone protein DnaJ [Paraburkholderia caffeinitolerans]|uniref:Chaperone protein DnaJ n=1 Tax=Paraburkholderia caffeinitolerans TaxID=1723730 RepID=A0A6J5GKC5_9BURK|nr:J domain-containing protein [Paraburkholderia caffeinitolerans]CAB3802403.1 Chaperone protein DnaJ [Paraburkholderia caffeinitolerans]